MMENVQNKKEVKTNNIFEKKFNELPDELLKSFTKRSIRDTNEIISNKNSKLFHKVAYVIYRAYCIGYILGKK